MMLAGDRSFIDFLDSRISPSDQRHPGEPVGGTVFPAVGLMEGAMRY
jgi:hypothetical protein